VILVALILAEREQDKILSGFLLIIPRSCMGHHPG